MADEREREVMVDGARGEDDQRRSDAAAHRRDLDTTEMRLCDGEALDAVE